jgi:carboxyl-terminal processing protease
MVEGSPVPALHGVWRSRGYGYLVKIDQDGPTLFHVAGDYCYADPRPERDPEGLFTFYRPLETDTVAFSGELGWTLYVFDRLQGLPPACGDTGRWTPARIAALTAATFADLYPSFEERGIDWQARTAGIEQAFDEKSDDVALFQALQAMLAGVEDPHVELRAEVAGRRRSLEPGDGPTLGRLRAAGNGGTSEREWEPAYLRGILNTVLQGKGQQTANDKLIWGRVGDIGYLNLLGMANFSPGDDDDAVLDAALDQAIAAFKGARAVIVDVTNNHGGYDSHSYQVAARFADRRRFAYTKVAYGARDVAPQPFYIEPSKRGRYLGPVYLLTSDVTLSAAEVFTLYMRALPNVVHVGGTTRGAFSDVIEKPLPNGWWLNISAEIYRDPQGRSYEVQGLPPQIRREVFPPSDLSGGHARAVLALMDEIRRGNGSLKAQQDGLTR